MFCPKEQTFTLLGQWPLLEWCYNVLRTQDFQSPSRMYVGQDLRGMCPKFKTKKIVVNYRSTTCIRKIDSFLDRISIFFFSCFSNLFDIRYLCVHFNPPQVLTYWHLLTPAPEVTTIYSLASFFVIFVYFLSLVFILFNFFLYKIWRNSVVFALQLAFSH